MYCSTHCQENKFISQGWKIPSAPSCRRTRQTRVADGLKRQARTCLLLLLSATTSALADDTINEPHFDFEIPRQRADLALTVFAEQANLTLIVPHDILEGKISNELVGRYSLQEGIDVLLAGTGLSPAISNHVVLSISVETTAVPGGNMNVKKKVGLLAALTSLFTSGANAQTPNDASAEEQEPLPLEEIIVTGTNIRGLPNDAAPVITFDREAIEASGFGTAQQLLETLPQNFGGGIAEDSGVVLGTRNGSNLNLSLGAGVNLRGLGSDSTLVLVNGRRLSPGGLGSFVDVSMIPLTAVERVDVLTDGASAIYGSDAVGGVVNFVLRDGYQGAETKARYGSVTEGNLEEILLSQVLGAANDRGSVTFVYEYYDRSNLDSSDRSFSEPMLDPSDLLPEQDRHSVFLSGNYHLTESVDIFATAISGKRKAASTASDPRSIEQQVLQTRSNVTDISTVVGFGYNFADTWRVETAALYSETDTDFGVTDGITGAFREGRDLTFETTSLQLKADGSLATLPGGDVRLAVGGEYRTEDYFRFIFGPITNPDNLDTINPNRRTIAAFGELFVPLVGESNARRGMHRLEVSLAARHEDYDDFSGSSTDPKLSALWSPISWLTLRGTYGTSFKAPYLNEKDTSLTAVVYFPLPDPESPTGSRAAALAFGPVDDLGPEESETITFGIDLRPQRMPGLEFQLTYFGIEFEDRIDSEFAFLDAFTNPLFAAIVTRDPDIAFIRRISEESAQGVANPFGFAVEDIDGFVDNRVRNIAVTKTSGIDMLARYTMSSKLGEWLFTLNGNYLFELENQLTPSAQVFDVVATAFNPVDLRVRAGATLAGSGFSLTTYVNYLGSYTDDQVIPNETIPSWTTFDLNATLDLGDTSNSSWLSGVRLALSIQNMFDRDPPKVDELGIANVTAGYDTENASPLGRFIALQLSKRW